MSKRERPSLVNFLKHFEEQKKRKETVDENKPPEQVSKETEQIKSEELFKTRTVYVPKVVVPKPTISDINDKTRKTLKLEELASKYNSYIKDQLTVHRAAILFYIMDILICICTTNQNNQCEPTDCNDIFLFSSVY